MKLTSAGVVAFAAGMLLVGAAFGETAKGKRKNVLFVAVDDLRLELGCYGASHMKTPNIDRLAKEGLLFERAYCQQALCAPSRISLMTGLRPDSTRIYGLDEPLDKTLPDTRTIVQHFKENDYKTILLGKIYHHATDDKQFCDVLDRCDAPTYAAPATAKEVERLTREGSTKGLSGQKLRHYANGPAYESADVPDNTYSDGRIADSAIEQIRKKDERPLFLAVGFKKPHLPFVAPKKYWDMYAPNEIEVPPHDKPDGAPDMAFTSWGELRNYAGMPEKGYVTDEQAKTLIHGYRASVSYIDAQLGRVLAELDRQGLRENTIVVLWGDHGWKLGEYGSWCKHTNFELDTHVPLIYCGQGIPAGKRSRALVEYVDIFPTLADYCGLGVPEECEGLSSAPLFADPAKHWKQAAFSQYPRGPNMGYSIRSGQWRYTEWQVSKTGKVFDRELYDHTKSDIAVENLVDKPEYKKVVAEMATILKAGPKGALPGGMAVMRSEHR